MRFLHLSNLNTLPSLNVLLIQLSTFICAPSLVTVFHPESPDPANTYAYKQCYT